MRVSIMFCHPQKGNLKNQEFDLLYIFCMTGLMISGFAHAYQVSNNKSYLEKAIRAAEFVRKHLYNGETGSLARNAYRDINGLVLEQP